MLQPSNRLTLLDAMRPPSGHTLDAAMAVTFTLDLRALLAAPAAFVLRAAEGLTDDGSKQEPIELLHAVRNHAAKFTVLSQVGEIALPPSRRVFAFLERSVVPVRAPLGGVVHPKVWVLRYRSGDDVEERRLRVLVASRNLTFDASWDTVVRLDEADHAGADLANIGAMFEGLIDRAPFPVAAEHATRVASLATDLRAAAFALPPAVDELRVEVLGLRRRPSPLPADVDRSLVISPFVGDDFFTEGRSARLDELVSRPEQLECLASQSLAHVGTTWGFDDGSAVEPAPDEAGRSPHDPGRPLIGLHAKLFAFEQGSRARLFIGSANATGAAFTRNVEVLLELRGSVAKLGIDRLCAGSDDEAGLCALFVPYKPTGAGALVDEETIGLDNARRTIAALEVTGVVEPDGDGWSVTYSSTQELPEVAGASIEVWPLAAPGHRRAVAAGRPLDERFPASLETISGFLAVVVTHDSGIATEFVVPVPLEGVPEARDRGLLRTLIGNAERFLRYLLALLDDDGVRVELLDAVEAPVGDGADGPGSSLPVLEKLLRSMRREPAKLMALHPLVTDLAADDALPDGFAELWASVQAIAVREETS